MNKKKIISAAAAGIICVSACVPRAFAKDNIYAYNKFISTVIGPQLGYCDFSASFAGYESEYDNVCDYFSGLISAYYDDIDMDFDNELITVESGSVSVYEAQENGVMFLGEIGTELIANFGASYSNVFTVPVENKKYIGVEVYSSVGASYLLQLYALDPDTDELNMKLEIKKTKNEDEQEENVWADGKTYYSYTNSYGLQTVMNDEGYENVITAARAALAYFGIEDWFPESYNRLCFDDETLALSRLTDNQYAKAEASKNGDDFRISHIISGVTQLSYIRATGLRFSDKPLVMFEDYTPLAELAVKPDIVTVILDGNTLQFPDQDPMIIDDRTLVPMRTIFEALGADVQWIEDNGSQKVIANTAGRNIAMTINSSEYYVNGEKKELDVPAQLINDRTLVPLRAVSESLGCQVDWNDDTKTAVITSQIEQPSA